MITVKLSLRISRCSIESARPKAVKSNARSIRPKPGGIDHNSLSDRSKLSSFGGNELNFSIRNLLSAVGFIAVAAAALRYGGVLAWLTIGLVAAFALAMGIVVSVANRTRRVFAIGFLFPFIAYGLVHYLSAHDETNLYDSKLPTTQLLKSVFQGIETREYYDRNTSEILADYDPDAPQAAGPRRSISWRETPERRSFATLGHALMAMMCGLAGGFFALRIRDDKTGG